MDEPLWLTRIMVEALHADQIREHSGQPGLRDASLLASALARPQHVWSYDESCDLASLAAEVRLRPCKESCVPGWNKRVAFVATNVFPILNGFEIEAAEPDVVDTMLRSADGRLSRQKFATWIRQVIVPYAE